MMTEIFQELVKETISKIERLESRSRSRSAKAQISFNHAVETTLIDLWKATHCIPSRECAINKRAGYYSENPRYRDPLLTYNQTIAVFDGLLSLGYIEITKEGYFDRATLQGSLTKFVARDELLERLHEIQNHPALTIKPDFDRESIILRNVIDGQRKAIEYDDTPKTEEYRRNLKTINQCFQKHWADLEIKDSDLAALEDRISSHDEKQPIDLSALSLVRIFSNGSFKEGGRFYRGWWQNVPSEYRKHITIDMKRTVEYDFSQLNPHMLYYAYNKELGEEDAYDRVFDGEHRDLVKSAFNAMIQASSPLRNCPMGIDPSVADMSWSELRDRIIAAHKPIADLFFRGEGNKVQFVDSCICEGVMLHFAAMDAPALPIHDSFIMHHGFGGELEEAMRREFHKRLGGDIPTSEEMLKWTPADDSPPKTVSVDEIFHADKEYSKWQARNDAWFAQRK
jgi:hypothetical protein